jgi:hypothetical protein
MQTSMGLQQMPYQQMLAGQQGQPAMQGQEQLMQLLMMLMGGGQQQQPSYDQFGTALQELLNRQMGRLHMHDRTFPGEMVEGDLLAMLMGGGSPIEGLMGPQQQQQMPMGAQMPGGMFQ